MAKTVKLSDYYVKESKLFDYNEIVTIDSYERGKISGKAYANTTKQVFDSTNGVTNLPQSNKQHKTISSDTTDVTWATLLEDTFKDMSKTEFIRMMIPKLNLEVSVDDWTLGETKRIESVPVSSSSIGASVIDDLRYLYDTLKNDLMFGMDKVQELKHPISFDSELVIDEESDPEYKNHKLYKGNNGYVNAEYSYNTNQIRFRTRKKKYDQLINGVLSEGSFNKLFDIDTNT